MEQPDQPEQIPSYVAEGIQRQDTATLRAIIQYCERLINYYDREVHETELGDQDEEVLDVEETDSGTVVIKKVPCGKDRCSTCPHGPYKYLVSREGDTLNWDYKGAVDR